MPAVSPHRSAAEAANQHTGRQRTSGRGQPTNEKIWTHINSMVQTKQGAGGNPWIEYMRACAANYRAGQAQHHSAAGKQSEAPTAKLVQKRLVGKQTPAAAAAAPNVKPTIDAKAARQLEKVVKAAGKARAAKVAKSATKS
jgi:hypothetical protein